ncbi:MAG: hypothetical protein Fur009_4280 [Candidatus Microgenomates bacterium]
MKNWLVLLPEFLINISAGYFLTGIANQAISQFDNYRKIIIILINIFYAIIFYILAIISYQINK